MSIFNNSKLTVEERITKARIRIQGKNPFFSYLSFFLKFEEAKENDGCFSMGVYPDGTCVYDKDWVDKLTDDEIQGVILHELCHLSFLHILRAGTREHTKWNIAIDLATNAMLIANNFTLPKDGIIPRNDEWEPPAVWKLAQAMQQAKNNPKKGLLGANLKNMKGYNKITEISKKTAEEIYDLLPDVPEVLKSHARGRLMKSEGGQGNGKGGQLTKEQMQEGNVGGWDKHNMDKKDAKDGKGMSEAEKNEAENEWLNRVEEAYIHAKQKGNVPLGLERYIDELKKSQINWKALLQKYITALIPQDYTFLKRSKRSVATGYYMPGMVKEKIDVMIGIDTSGSIGKEELTDFLSEIIGMAKAYKDRLTIRVMSHDTKVHTDNEVKNGNIDKIKKIEIKGGGGTSHAQILEYIEEKYPKTRVFVSFTDGYSDLQDIKLSSFNFAKIFILSKGGTDEWQKKNSNDCFVIKLRE